VAGLVGECRSVPRLRGGVVEQVANGPAAHRPLDLGPLLEYLRRHGGPPVGLGSGRDGRHPVDPVCEGQGRCVQDLAGRACPSPAPASRPGSVALTSTAWPPDPSTCAPTCTSTWSPTPARRTRCCVI